MKAVKLSLQDKFVLKLLESTRTLFLPRDVYVTPILSVCPSVRLSRSADFGRALDLAIV